ncbi:MAG: EAL domain-containing protein [Synechocystis sp.]|nr:EAL domain-containing protein [Synechocystis sp.]
MLESSQITILIIDDSPVNLHVLSKLMQQLGWQVISAMNGEEGIEQVEKISPTLILLDILMPGIDGFEVCRLLKNNPKTQHIPIIFLSALTDSDSIVRGLDVGAVDYIHKPFKQEEVIARLNLQIKLYQTYQALAAKQASLEKQIQVNEKIRSELVQSEANFSITFQYSPDSIFIHGLQGGVMMDANECFLQLTGLKKEKLIGLTFFDLPLWINVEQYYQFYQQTLHPGTIPIRHGDNWEIEVYDADQNIHTMLLLGRVIKFNQLDCLLVVMRDVTELKQTQKQLKILSQACEQSPASIVITDVEGNITYVNPKFEEISGYCSIEVLGKNPKILKSGDKSEQDYRTMWHQLSSGQDWKGEFHNRRKDGQLYWERASISPIINSLGEITHYVAVKEDITQEKNQAEALYHQAHYDNLTGLPNRSLAKDRLQQAIELAIRHQYLVGLMFIDLDNFKMVNDSLGHDAGDRLLKEVAERLQRALRQTDTVARLGGDEFLVVINKVSQTRKLTAIAQRLLGVLRQPVTLNGHEIFIYGSIGIAVFPDDGLQADSLLKNADTAMYAAKLEGRNGFRFFTPSMNDAAQKRLLMESKLRQGLARQEFKIYYQPFVDLQSGKIIGAEALMRWHNDHLGDVPPDQFIPIAEDLGVIIELGEWLMDQVCQQAAHWQDFVTPDQPQFLMAANISPRQLRDNYFIDILQSLIKQYRLKPEWLTLEITEHLMLEDNADLLKNLQDLTNRNISLALDDFGTGYSSLNYLRQFDFSILKIDRCFIQQLPDNADTANLVRAIIAMAHHLQLTVIAEGIETQAQWDFLQAEHCDYGQGYYFSPAIAPDALAKLWQTQLFQQRLSGGDNAKTGA